MPAERDADERAGEWLRAALLALPAEGGWSGPTGVELLEALRDQCGRLATVVERRSGQRSDPHRAADLMSRAWEILATRPGPVIAAANPWAYLTRCLVSAGVNAALADRFMVGHVAVQGGAVPANTSLHRIGEEVDVLDRAQVGVRTPHANEATDIGWDSALRQLHADLVTAGAPDLVTAAAIDRVVQLVAMNRNGHREAAASRDRVLAALGVSPRQAAALVGLVAGTRRGGAAESLWARRRVAPSPEGPVITAAVRRRIDAYVHGFADELKVPA